MRDLIFLILGLVVSASSHASEALPRTASAQLPYPTQVALMHERLGWTYRKSTTGLPLYFSEADSPGKSACYGKCAMQWIPLIAPVTEKSLGQWTIVVRKDGVRQWAFRGRPIYTHIHDTPQTATRAGHEGTWHLMPHFT